MSIPTATKIHNTSSEEYLPVFEYKLTLTARSEGGLPTNRNLCVAEKKSEGFCVGFILETPRKTSAKRTQQSWDKVENPNPQSTPHVLPSFEEYTPPVTYPKELEETLGTPVEVEPLDETQLEDLGLNTCNHDLPLSRKVPNLDEPKPQPQPFSSFPSLEVDLGEEKDPELPIKPPSPDSFRLKEVDHLTIHTPPSPHVASSHPKDMYCYYRPCIDDPKKHYGFKPGLLEQGGSLGVEFYEYGR
ncbi:hypothetical protein Tco_0821534 [Tanacetum coccineum]|uniref:Uncharacterized protein n=1 Tax=Tanacetum coccineum TaxID=301880 RepID=A0ABQ5ACI2_9ASTR